MAGNLGVIDVASRETFAQIKALNRQLAKARTAAERERLCSLIDAAKAEWWRRVAPLFAERAADAKHRHKELMDLAAERRNGE